MKLVFSQTYKSIGALENPPELRMFSIITGVNGSGKTHLLEAIASSKVQVFIDHEPVEPAEIRSFSWRDLDVGETLPADVSARTTFVSQYWPIVQNIKNNFQDQLRARLAQLGAVVQVSSQEALFVLAGNTLYREDDSIRNILLQVNQQILANLHGQSSPNLPWNNRIEQDVLVPGCRVWLRSS